MFYTVISEEGFCYIPTVSIVDEENFSSVYPDAQVIELETITKANVDKLLGRGDFAVKHRNPQVALEMAQEIYKKLPRYRRQLDYATEPSNPNFAVYQGCIKVRGAGSLESEIADRYL